MLPTPRHQRSRWVLALGTLQAFQAVGWYIVWGGLIVEAKMLAEKTFSAAQAPLQHLTISVADLAPLWVGKREIRLADHVYDVLAQIPQGDSVRLELYHDQPEEVLFQTLSSLLSIEHSTALPLRTWLLQWMGGVYVLPESPVLPQRLDTQAIVCFHYRLMNAQHQPSQLIPPPKG
ncbi:MAG: hypothetical protein LH618_18685 [Saprospiraceae bacterium]|nr:hypothetical protein [Saprospiraceae bacterium]